MSKQLHQLMEAYYKTSPGAWDVVPMLRPDLDDDPMCEYVIQSHQPGLTGRYFAAEPDSAALAAVHQENAANAEFIALAHNALPNLLERIGRMEEREYEWEQAVSGGAVLLDDLGKTAAALDKFCDQINQYKAKAPDDAILELLSQIEGISSALKPYLWLAGRESSRRKQVNKIVEHYYGKEAALTSAITRVDQEGRYRFLFAHNQRQQGLFLVDDVRMGNACSRSVFKEIANEAKRAGLSGTCWHIFAATCPYLGPGVEFYQLPGFLLREAQP